jgi:hypothetical protein
MYLLYHLNKTSELPIHGLFSISCGKRQEACVDEVLGCGSSSYSFCVFVEGSAS